ncbi:MAG: hypothetical protein K1W31_03220 [Lachnospiraceae bacterium]
MQQFADSSAGGKEVRQVFGTDKEIRKIENSVVRFAHSIAKMLRKGHNMEL